MITEELASAGERVTAGLQTSIPQMPRIEPMRPDLQPHGHIGYTCHDRKASGILKQPRGRPHLD